ncbi:MULTISPECIES: YnaM/YnfT family protein [Enterobacteriaceae]
MSSYIIVTSVAVVMGLIMLSLIKVWISTSNNPDNL